MRVKMKIKIGGTRNGVEWPEAGGEIDLPDEEAAGYCKRGYCIPVDTRSENVETRDEDDERPKRRGRPAKAAE